MQPVGDAAQAAAATDHLPAVVGAQNDVDAVVAKPCALVEAMLGTFRELQDPEELEPRPLRRHAAGRQLEQDVLAYGKRAEAQDARTRAHLEAPLSRLRGDLDESVVRPSHPRHEHALVQGGDPNASPPPAGEEQGDDEKREPARSRKPGSHEHQDRRAQRDRGRREPGDIRHRQPYTESRRGDVGRMDRGPAHPAVCLICEIRRWASASVT